MDLSTTLDVSASGLRAQDERMRVVAENIANADSTGTKPGELPYRRKTITFKNVLDQKTGAMIVKASKFGEDPSPFKARFEPGHPAANAQGYVLLPNVNPTIEMMDMKEAQRSYEANLNAMETTKRMLVDTIDLLK